MGLSNTIYSYTISAMAKGYVAAYSKIYDPLVMSGFLQDDNVTFVNHILDGGASVTRTTDFNATPVLDQTKHNFNIYSRNVESTITQKPFHFKSGVDFGLSPPDSFNLEGIVEDPFRIDNLLSGSPALLPGLQHITNTAALHAGAAYTAYLKNFVKGIFANCNLKETYDTTTGDSGKVLTYAQDRTHDDFLSQVNFNDGSLSGQEKAFRFKAELYKAIAPLKFYTHGELIYLLVPELALNTIALHLDHFSPNRVRMADDVFMDGNRLFSNSSFYSLGDIVIVGLPGLFDKEDIGAGVIAYNCALASRHAIKVVMSSAQMADSISFSEHFSVRDLMNVDPNALYDMMRDNPELVSALSLLGTNKIVRPEIAQNNKRLLPNITKMSAHKMPMGHDLALYTLMYAECKGAVLRAQPNRMRKFHIKETFI